MRAKKEVHRGMGPKITRRALFKLLGQGRPLSHETFELRQEEGAFWMKRMFRRLGRTWGNQVTRKRPVWLESVNKERVSKDEVGGKQRSSRGPWEETGFHSRYRAAFETKTTFYNTHT